MCRNLRAIRRIQFSNSTLLDMKGSIFGGLGATLQKGRQETEVKANTQPKQMSDFASLLSSFKVTAQSAAAAPPAEKTGKEASRKRASPSASSTALAFPSIHIHLKKKSFDLRFLILGGQKCGTTWIHTLLQKCKQVSLPAQKEVHFWDWHYKKGIDWYIRQFEENSSKHLGEITPDYVVLPPSTIAEISRCFPKLRLVFIARDLVERAWSAMVMELRDQNMGLNPGEFAEGVIQGDKRNAKRAKPNVVSTSQQRRLQQLSSPSSQPDSYFIERLEHETHKSRSDYATSLKNWYQYFPDDAILLIDYRYIRSDPRGVLYKIVTHVGVDEDLAKQYVDELDEEEVRQRVNVSTNNDNSSKSLSQRPLLKKQMEKCMAPYVASFNSLLRQKGYTWSLNDYT